MGLGRCGLEQKADAVARAGNDALRQQHAGSAHPDHGGTFFRQNIMGTIKTVFPQLYDRYAGPTVRKAIHSMESETLHDVSPPRRPIAAKNFFASRSCG